MNALASVGSYRTLYGPDDGPTPHITVRGLSKTFQGVVIYDDFNLDIPPAVSRRCSDRTAAGNRR